MTTPSASEAALPLDPTFPPAAYERVARLLRAGVLGFLVFAGAGMVAQLVLYPQETVGMALSTSPVAEYRSFGVFVDDLALGRPDSFIILGIYVMLAVTIGRVVLATFDFYRGGERALGTISLAVVLLLLVGLFIVGPFVH